MFHKSPKTLFLGHFCPKSREREFSQIWDLSRKLANHMALILGHFQQKLMTQFCAKVQKPYFQAFWALFPIFLENESFPEKSGSVTFEPSCKISKKTNESIPRKLHYRRTNTQLKTGGLKMSVYQKTHSNFPTFYNYNKNRHCRNIYNQNKLSNYL